MPREPCHRIVLRAPCRNKKLVPAAGQHRASNKLYLPQADHWTRELLMQRQLACPGCDQWVAIDALARDEAAVCPNCGAAIASAGEPAARSDADQSPADNIDDLLPPAAPPFDSVDDLLPPGAEFVPAEPPPPDAINDLLPPGAQASAGSHSSVDDLLPLQAQDFWGTAAEGDDLLPPTAAMGAPPAAHEATAPGPWTETAPDSDVRIGAARRRGQRLSRRQLQRRRWWQSLIALVICVVVLMVVLVILLQQ